MPSGSSTVYLTQHNSPARPTKLFQRSCTLDVQCNMDAATGRVKGKREAGGPDRNEYAYSHDKAGHLTHVWLDGFLNEEYGYNAQGKRMLRVRTVAFLAIVLFAMGALSEAHG